MKKLTKALRAKMLALDRRYAQGPMWIMYQPLGKWFLAPNRVWVPR